MELTTDDLRRIMDSGGGVAVDARKMSIDDIRRVVAHAARRRVMVLLQNSHVLLITERERLASGAKGSIIFA